MSGLLSSFLASSLAVVLFSASAAEPVPWNSFEGYRYFEVNPFPGNASDGFTAREAGVTGIHFTNILSTRLVAMNRVTENGSGVALGDVDGDGWCDIYLCGLERSNALYRNLGGWKFEEITGESGVELPDQLSTGAVLADVDGDVALDLLVNSIGGGTRLFLNDGKGKFSEKTDGRLARRFAGTSMALADIDLDGDLDLYVANYRTIFGKDEFPRAKAEARMRNGEIQVTPPGRYVALGQTGGNVDIFELAERDFLYVNDGSGNFSPVSWTNGNFLDETGQALKSAPLDWALSVMMRDLNDDGLIDILVCNDFFNSPDRIWFQKPGLRFQSASLSSIRKISLASMAVDVADVNRDGFDDLFFVEMLSRDFSFRQTHRDNLVKARFNLRMTDPRHRWEISRNTLFLNRGDGSYSEVAELAGLDASEWSWGAIFLDVDLDGWEDVLIPTGHNHDVQNDDILRRINQSRTPDSIEQRTTDLKQFPKLMTPLLAFRNDHKLGFEEIQSEWGLNIPGVLHGLACADLDNDGDLDLVGNRLNDGTLLLRNNSARNRIAIRLAGNTPNGQGVGAKITIRGGPVVQSQHMISGGRYLSTDDTIRTFACGRADQLSVEVRWPDGTQTVLSDLRPNRVYEISQKATPSETPLQKSIEPFFSERDFNHRHIAPAFDDFARQPFLPYNLGTPGPSLAWADIDRDGLDDLVIGGSAEGQMTVFRNTGKDFAQTNLFGTGRLSNDQGALVVVRLDQSANTILSANSNYKSGDTRTPSVELRTMHDNLQSLPSHPEAPGTLALADIDSDGDLDLFVAGRVLPGRFPEPVRSRLYRNTDGKFSLDADLSRPFEKLGLVTSAQFSDFNNDGRPDLATALEWGAPQVFINRDGHLAPASMGLDRYRGWWMCVITGDFNNDGLTDIVAGNWGRNTRYERFINEKPLRLYHGDVDGNGTYEAIESIFNPSLKKYVPMVGPEMIVDHLPTAAERIPTFEAFAGSSIEQIIGNTSSPFLEIDTMESICFINRGSTFEPHPLPLEAQFAPVLGMAAADFDNDGHQDLVLGQNIFDTRWDLGRLDSGRALWLRGDGTGNFAAVSASASGLSADGQQRAVAIADFNRDGRMDVAITKHNDFTKLFENRLAEPGVRIRFEGKGNNPDAIGTRFHIISGGRSTGLCEIQAGGGWFSQNSFVQLVRKPAAAARLHVQWPGGQKNEFDFPFGASEVMVSDSGIKVVR